MALSKIDPKLAVQEVSLTDEGLKLKCPFSMVISGPSQAGKSYFLYQIVKFRHYICSENFERIIYCQSNTFSHKNQIFIQMLQKEFPNLELCQGLPKLGDLQLSFNNSPKLILVDDLMDDVLNSVAMYNMVSTDVHNYNISIVFVMQNYYATGKYGKTFIRNCHYRVFFYNPIEQLELRNISTSISTIPSFFNANFEFLSKTFPMDQSYYLLIDGHFQSPANKMWCRSKIFPDEITKKITPIVFFPNHKYKKK